MHSNKYCIDNSMSTEETDFFEKFDNQNVELKFFVEDWNLGLDLKLDEFLITSQKSKKSVKPIISSSNLSQNLF